MTKNWKRRLRAGFTLTELAMVTALMSSIPTASYVKVKQRALQTKCVSNLRNIGQALMMYKMDEGCFPKAAFYPKRPTKDATSIRVMLANQGAGDARLWCCPSMPDRLQKKGLTFVYNDALGGKNNASSKTWVLIEFTCISKKAPPPHPSGYNILYADGSVRTTRKLPPEITKTRKAMIRKIQKGQAYASNQ